MFKYLPYCSLSLGTKKILDYKEKTEETDWKQIKQPIRSR